MANEFIVRKGLIVEGASGGTVVDIQGSQGQLFSVTDDLSGSIFAVSDISGVPIFDVNSSGVSYFDGNVGIGTTSPYAKTQINGATPTGTTGYGDAANSGQLYLTSNAAVGSQLGGRIAFGGIAGNGGGAFSGTRQDSVYGTIEGYKFNATANNSGGGLTFKTNFNNTGVLTERMNIAQDGKVIIPGNVGIGTTDPGNKLHVLSADNASATNIARFSSNNNNVALAIGYNEIRQTADANSLYLGVHSGTAVTILDGGNVGIGTTNPGTKLHVNSENAEGTLSLSRGGNDMVSGQGVGSIVFPADYNGTPTIYGKIVSYANALSALRGSLDFKVKSTAGSLLTGMTLYGTSAGVNVGIGTTAPGEKLYVNGNQIITNNLSVGTTAISTTAKLQVLSNVAAANAIYGLNYQGDGSGVSAQTYRTSGTGTAYGIRAQAGNSGTQAGTNIAGWFNANGTGTTNYSIITTAGFVGINTASPSQQLHVSGNARVTGAYYDSNNSAGTAGQVLSSTATGTDWVDASSGSTAYTAAIWQVENDIFTTDNTTIICDTTRIYNGTTSVSTAGATSGSLVIDDAGVYEISYSVSVRVPQSGAPSTRQVPALYLTETRPGASEGKIPGSVNSAYLRLYGSNQGGFTSFSNKVYFAISTAGTEIQLKIVWLDGTDKDAEIFNAASIPNTISIRRIT